ncbi:MAG: N-acylglucosamine 2-epimerase [bacterium]|nr:N-acylglucosamine 2-epimerase [bacterium]
MTEATAYTKPELEQLAGFYRDALLDDTVPFWIKHSIDREHGGYLFGLGRDGTVISPDKYMWLHGRFIWLLSTLYSDVEPRDEWLELARHGLDFMRAHGFDTDGRMFFSCTREGKPIRKRRYLFTESFGVVGLAAYAKAAQDDEAAQQALDLFKLMIRYHTTPGLLESKFVPGTRPGKGLAMPMVLTVTAQVLRETIDDPICTEWIDRSIEEAQKDFMKPEFECVLEGVGPNGELLDTFEGRLICPGHSIELGWFILHEAKLRGNDAALREIGLKVLDWSWKLGWDDEFGGIIYYRDAKGLPPTEYWHDMKFWWPQNEAIIATLLAHQLTGDAKYAQWHRMAHEWAHARFPDPEHGEWYGYLHRDGRLSTPLKGNNWKGPFHLPRMQHYCWRLAEEMGK